MYSTKDIISAVQESWSSYTAFNSEDWSESNPARGQCVVSSMVIQDILGGTLQKVKVYYDGQKESHYRNILPDGSLLDITRSQYPENQKMEIVVIALHSYNNIREKLFSQADTEKRYKILRASVLQKLT